MKKLFLLLALMGMVAVGCSKDDADKGNDNKTEQPNEDEGGNIPDDAYISLNKEIVTISPDGGSVDVIVYSNYKWEISGTSDWCTPSAKSGDANEDGQKVTFSADVAYDDREATFWFRCADKQIKFVVSQKLKEVIIPDANNTFNIPSVGGVAVISYQTSVDCEIIIPDDAQDWVTIAPATRGLSTYSTTLNIAENNSGKERSCVIKVTSQGDNELSAEYTITQRPRYCLYYTSSNGGIVQPNNSSSFGATIISNTYKDGVGVIDFNTPITTIGDYAFRNCDSLTSVTIPDSVTTIGDYTFYKCSSLTSITIGDSVTTIGNYAFCNCDSLTSVTIPDSVTTIGEYAFGYCSSLTSITIGDSVTTIGYNAFFGCSSLTSVTIGDSLTTIGNYAFCTCDSLTSITIGDSVTTIGDYAFRGCSCLTSVTIPDSVTKIGKCAFEDCSSLTSVTIPDSVTTIGLGAFRYCSSLTSITIGDSVTTIGMEAFKNCSSLTSVYCKPTTPPSLGDYVFVTYLNTDLSYCYIHCKIYVPMESVEAYKSAYRWSDYASDIVGYNF